MKKTQHRMAEIQLDRIEQNDVKKLLRLQMANGVSNFNDLRATYSQGDDLSEHKIHVKTFFINASLDRVWQHYNTANPAAVWNGEMLSFGLMVSGSAGEIVYPGDPYMGAQSGQVFYVSLKIFGGLLRLAIAHKIIDVDEGEKSFTLSYVEGGETVGMQKILLTEAQNDNTKITHTTYYKGRSPFREKWLYPWFHDKAISEYHANMRRSLDL